jgi:hypothetical protein
MGGDGFDGSMMRLRCVRGGYGSPFREGEVYDVAEVMEHPRHAMVRRPGGRWPKPGERWFGWHPEEWFASPPGGLEIVSCGYEYREVNCFGVVIPASRYRRVPRFESRLARVMEGLPESMGYLWRARARGVRTSCCVPALERNFYVVGVDHDRLGREVSYRAAGRAVRRVLAEVGVSGLAGQVGDLNLEYWEKLLRRPERLTWEAHAGR